MKSVLAYGLLPPEPRTQSYIYETDRFDIHDVPLGHPDSFLEFDGVVALAGIFETGGPKQVLFHQGGPPPWVLRCVNADELARRLRESHSLLEKGGHLVFLVPRLADQRECETTQERPDLFRRVMQDFGFEIEPMPTIIGNAPCLVPEFSPYLERHGAASVQCVPPSVPGSLVTEICRGTRSATGFAVNDRLFVLPCHLPPTHDSALDMVDLAASCVADYRERVSVELPAWLSEFRFTREATLLEQAAGLERESAAIEAQLSVYMRYKRILAAKSTPLVEHVVAILSDVFGLTVRRDEKFIDDACLIGTNGVIEGVLEIKGDTGSFKRVDVGQVDGHRERLELPLTTPGLLIMNTMMKAANLEAKDHAPHPDIIAKAVSDNVLMIRTLDLLRYADLIEQGRCTQDDFRKHVLGDTGWLKVKDKSVEIVRGEKRADGALG